MKNSPTSTTVPTETFRAFVGQLLFHGMSVDEVKTIAQKVPARVLGLEVGGL